MAVFVLDKHQRPWMPCSEKPARLLLERGRAGIHKRYSFPMRLVDRVQQGSVLQDIPLKFDPGTKITGVAVTLQGTPSTKAVFLSDRFAKAHITDKLDSRSGLRRARRNRKTRYRQSRFLHRKRRTGWLPPSLQTRVNKTVNAAVKLRKFLPIAALSAEHVKCDTHKLETPETSGAEYQQSVPRL